MPSIGNTHLQTIFNGFWGNVRFYKDLKGLCKIYAITMTLIHETHTFWCVAKMFESPLVGTIQITQIKLF